MSVPTDAVFEIPSEGDNDGPRSDDAPRDEVTDVDAAYVDEDNVPHPHGADDADEAEDTDQA